jgi:hypothetical protein
MQTDPTARHSPIGSFQRVCYLVHLARDGRMAAAPGTRPPALHPDRRHARWEGQTEVAVDLSGVGRFPKAFGAKLAHQPGSTGMGRGTGATCLVCPVLTEPPGLAAQPIPRRPGRSRTRLRPGPTVRQRQRRRGRAGHHLAVAAKAFARHGLGMPALHPEAVRQRAIGAARQRSGQPATPTLDPVFVALNLGASRPGTVTGRAVPVGPPRGAVRDAERGRGGRAVQRKSRPPANHPRLGDHPTSRPQLPAGRPTR